jgi:hypothetical protein
MEVRKRGAALKELFPHCPAAVMGTNARRAKRETTTGRNSGKVGK